MALRTSLAVQPHLYIGDAAGRPLDYGSIYFGEPNKDPEFYPIDIFADEALTVPLSQPVRTKGGFINVNGDMTEVYAAEADYSVKVLDAHGVKVLYHSDMSSEDTYLSGRNTGYVELRDYIDTVGDDTQDHTAQILLAVEAARSSGKALHGSGKYYVKTGDINLRGVKVDLTDTEIFMTAPYKIILGGNSDTSLNPVQSLGIVRHKLFKYRDEDITHPTVRVIGAKGQNINIRTAQYLEFYMSTDPATYPKDSSIAYNTFNLGYVMKIVVDTDPRFNGGIVADGAGSANQWFNENVLNLEHCHVFKMLGSYKHNHNIINGGVFEGHSKIVIDIGNKNYFRNQRFEGSDYEIFLGENTQGNVIEKSWYGSEANHWRSDRITDLGRLNDVRHYQDKFANKRPVYSLSCTDTVYDGSYEVSVLEGSYSRVGNPHRITSAANYGTVYSSDFLSLGKSEVLFTNVLPNSYATANDISVYYIVELILYDADFNQITDVMNVPFEGIFANREDQYPDKLRGNVFSTSYFVHFSDTVKYVKVSLLCGTVDRAYAKQINCFIASRYKQDDMHVLKAKPLPTLEFTKVLPTAFYGRLGASVSCIPHGTLYNVKDLQSTVKSAINSTSFKINNRGAVAPTRFMATGYYVTIVSPTQQSHSSIVTNLVGDTVTLEKPMLFALRSGDKVYINQLVGNGKPL